MGFVIREKAILSDEFYKIFQRSKYEEFLCDLMNLSTIVFPHSYQHIPNQSNGECDFVDLVDHKKYDAKLPFDKKIGEIIGGQRDYFNWYKLFITLEEEFGEFIEKRGTIQIKDLKIYQIILDRINSTKADENVILFFPLPIVLDIQDSFTSCFMGDMLSSIFSELKKQINLGKEIIAVYPDGFGNIVLRRLNDNQREYLKYERLNKYFNYEKELNLD
jgi:hypothetical protein